MSSQLSPRLRFDSLNRLSSKLTTDLESQARGTSPAKTYSSSSLRTSSLLLRSSSVGDYATPRALAAPPAYYTPAVGSPGVRATSSIVDGAARTPTGGLSGAMDHEVRIARLEDALAKQQRAGQELGDWARGSIRAIKDSTEAGLSELRLQLMGDKSELRGLCGKIESKQHELDREATARSLENHTYFTGLFEAMRDKLAVDSAALIGRVDELGGETKAGFERLEGRTVTAMNNLDLKLAAELANLRAELGEMNVKFVDVFVGLDGKVEGADAAQSERASMLAKQLKKTEEKLDADLANGLKQLENGYEGGLLKLQGSLHDVERQGKVAVEALQGSSYSRMKELRQELADLAVGRLATAEATSEAAMPRKEYDMRQAMHDMRTGEIVSAMPIRPQSCDTAAAASLLKAVGWLAGGGAEIPILRGRPQQAD